MMVGFIEGERRGGINSQNWIGIGTTFRMVNVLTVASMMVRFIQRRGEINSLTWIGMGGNI